MSELQHTFIFILKSINYMSISEDCSLIRALIDYGICNNDLYNNQTILIGGMQGNQGMPIKDYPLA